MELQDSVTVGTPSAGGQVKVYLDFLNMTETEITRKVDAAINLYERLLIAMNKIKTKWK